MLNICFIGIVFLLATMVRKIARSRPLARMVFGVRMFPFLLIFPDERYVTVGHDLRLPTAASFLSNRNI